MEGNIETFSFQFWSFAFALGTTDILNSRQTDMFRRELSLTKLLFWLQMNQMVNENRRCKTDE